MSDATLARLTPIFRQILNPDVVVTESLDASQVEEWDSLNHISLVVAIEEEFDTEFTTDELAQLQNVGDLVRILESRRAGPAPP